MDLIQFKARLKEMEEFIGRMTAQAEQPQPKIYVEPRVRNLNTLITEKEYEDLTKVMARHSHKFGTETYNIARFLRVLVAHFVARWEDMPMVEARHAEEKLRDARRGK